MYESLDLSDVMESSEHSSLLGTSRVEAGNFRSSFGIKNDAIIFTHTSGAQAGVLRFLVINNYASVKRRARHALVKRLGVLTGKRIRGEISDDLASRYFLLEIVIDCLATEVSSESVKEASRQLLDENISGQGTAEHSRHDMAHEDQ